MSEQTMMRATDQAILHWLSERGTRAFPAVTLAEWLRRPLPKIVAALRRLADAGLVRYFPEHPGSWAITARGRRELER